MIKATKFRIILSGSILEVYKYDEPIYYGFESPQNKKSLRVKTEEEVEDIQKRSLARTRNTLRRLINANAWQWFDTDATPFTPKFVTLTFAENLTNLSKANSMYTNFVKRLNYEIFRTKNNVLKYTAVPEFQKRGAVHFHSIFYNLGWLEAKRLEEIWKNGFINIRDVSGVNNLGLYMTKYMTKDGMDKRLVGRKKYFASKGLKYPLLIRDERVIMTTLEATNGLPCVFEKEFDSEYVGTVVYKVFDLSSSFLLQEKIKEILR